jgi:hypothetical protein
MIFSISALIHRCGAGAADQQAQREQQKDAKHEEDSMSGESSLGFGIDVRVGLRLR